MEEECPVDRPGLRTEDGQKAFFLTGEVFLQKDARLKRTAGVWAKCSCLLGRSDICVGSIFEMGKMLDIAFAFGPSLGCTHWIGRGAEGNALGLGERQVLAGGRAGAARCTVLPYIRRQ